MGGPSCDSDAKHRVTHALFVRWLIYGSLVLACAPSGTSGEVLCAETINSTEPTFVTCDRFCFALWNATANANSSGSSSEETFFVKQGCWTAFPGEECKQEECISKGQKMKDPDAAKATDQPTYNSANLFFCCCSSPECNTNVMISNVTEEIEDHGVEDSLDPARMEGLAPGSLGGLAILMIVAIVFLMIGLFTLVGTVAWMKRISRKRKPGTIDDSEVGEKLIEPFFKEASWEITEPLILGEEIARGKFAALYSGKKGGADVALKVFSGDKLEYFENEKFIFNSLGETGHSHVVKYLGWQQFSVDNSQSLILALERIQPGNLRDYLDAATVDTLSLADTLKIMKGIAAGLSYLHGENRDEIVIAHRDLASKNVLIDTDLNCYISDFGLSLLTRGSKYYWSGKEREAEFCSLAEAGTLRYMAPELLEGAVNLKDCENALKQADVYALALILWEVANLCHDIALPPCTHRLPYEQELGKDISIDSLSRFVVTRRDRPSFSGWRDSIVSRSIRDTLNESWDPEPDARLTSLCIMERLSDLQQTKHTGSDSVTPLEAPPTSPWAGRNPCLQRNLLEETSEDKSGEYVISSEKHLIPNVNSRLMFMSSGIGSSSISSSDQSYSIAGTTNTDLSNSSARTGPQPAVVPNPIPFVQNIRK